MQYNTLLPAKENVDPLLKCEQLAISLRKDKKAKLLAHKRRHLFSNLTPQTV